MNKEERPDVRSVVLERYRDVVNNSATPGASAKGCCPAAAAESVGYSRDQLDSVPQGANLGLGCGNPGAIADLKLGEVVLDLGSGAGFDCFLAAGQVGPTGEVIGVDMTPEMVAKARANATKTKFTNVSFRLGEIEHLPLADASVDVIISNCVINLAPDKVPVYEEAFRVLKSGGRLAVSDVVATAAMPEELRQDLSLWSCCVSGASHVDEIKKQLSEVGFVDIRVRLDENSGKTIKGWTSMQGVEQYVLSAAIEAIKP